MRFISLRARFIFILVLVLIFFIKLWILLDIILNFFAIRNDLASLDVFTFHKVNRELIIFTW